ncbi:hypothetical protein [Collimonas fungivorans]|uniref:Uncharacterized protein n=1 Tax=Collimonas fungivorans (strain Ter331) TaxID=1005048 RepID=G0AG98_COLFT|nr:hypothetical protein [Collimonas fungivorans]AEK59989.1 hypothetical protein CFU_0151 [Collimonas fungivorans Ter331]
MPAISRDVQKTAGRHAMLAALAVAAAAAGIILYFFAEPGLLDSQGACLAAHAADYGVTTQQLRSDVSRQPELVAALSSCSGMAP